MLRAGLGRQRHRRRPPRPQCSILRIELPDALTHLVLLSSSCWNDGKAKIDYCLQCALSCIFIFGFFQIIIRLEHNSTYTIDTKITNHTYVLFVIDLSDPDQRQYSKYIDPEA